MVTTADLVSYYKCDTSSSFPDAHGTNTGTISGATYTASGKLSGAYSFDGVNDSISLYIFDVDTASKSIVFWFKANDLTTQQKLVSCRVGDNGTELNFRLQSSVLLCKYEDGLKSYSLTTSFSDTTNWHYFVMTYKSDEMKFYLDGDLKGTSSGASAVQSALSGTLYLGMDNRGLNYFDGLMDEVGIWERVLTSTEVSELYNSGNALAYPFSGGTTDSFDKINGVDYADLDEINGVSKADLTSWCGVNLES